VLDNKKLLVIATIYTITLAVLSLVSNDSIPYFGTNYEDKIYHLLAYGLLNVLWYKVLVNLKINNPILIAFTVSIIYGIIIEVLQGQFTLARDPSVLDIIANSIGVTIGSLFLVIKSKTIDKKI